MDRLLPRYGAGDEDGGANFTHGLNVYINGNLPDGAGLSSSASLEMLVGTILNSLFDGGFEPLELVQFGVKVEIKQRCWIQTR